MKKQRMLTLVADFLVPNGFIDIDILSDRINKNDILDAVSLMYPFHFDLVKNSEYWNYEGSNNAIDLSHLSDEEFDKWPGCVTGPFNVLSLWAIAKE